MIELIEVEGETYADKVDVIRCKDCAYSEGLETSRYRFCRQWHRWSPIDGYCDAANRTKDALLPH